MLGSVDESDLSGSSSPDRVYTKKKPTPVKQFSHLFNAYTKAFNNRYKRHGSLFERPFERIKINHEKYFRNLVWYIHNNPVHHGFVEHMIEYPWSSYQTMISVKPTRLSREKVVGWFNSRNEFQVFHQEDQNIRDKKRTLGKIMANFKNKHDPYSDIPYKKDIVLFWRNDAKRIITGADLLGRLLKGI